MKNKIVVILFIALLPLLLVFLLSFNFYYQSIVKSENSLEDYYLLTINEGEGVSQIADKLIANKVINSTGIFKLYLKLNKIDVSVQAGEYDIPPHVSIAELAKILQKGYFDRKLTFIEGERIEQYAVKLAEAVTKTDAEKQEYIERFLDYSKSEEGYLFPDTYSYNTTTTPEGMVDWMSDRFNEVVVPELNSNSTDLTNEQVMILASIVEREGNSTDDRSVIAGILVNRLNIDLPLFVDATSQYQIDNDLIVSQGVSSVEFWKAPITQDYLEADSPYNTRKSFGLPPNPICNPGIESILAVLNYADTDYFYYIHDNLGQVHYAKTLDEHNVNVSKYLGYN